MSQDDVRLERVFGISSKPVLSYVTRAEVDGRFANAIGDDHHVVVYGSSKQGKTALLSEHVEPGARVTVRCNPKHTTLEIYQSLLRQANVAIETFQVETRTTSGAVKTKLGFKARIPFLASGTAGVEAAGEC